MLNDELIQPSETIESEPKQTKAVEEVSVNDEKAPEETVSNVQGKSVAENEAGETKEAPSAESNAAEMTDAEKNARDFALFRVMPYVDLMNERTRIKTSGEELESMKSMFDHIGDMDAEARAIAQMDSATRTDMRSSIKEFYENYPSTKHEAERLQELVDGCVSLYEDAAKKSAAFMMQSMVESIETRLTSIENDDAKRNIPNYDLVVKRLKTIRESYANPVEFGMLFNKLAFPANTINLYKAFKKNGADDAMKYIEKVFINVFNDKFMKAFRHIFREIIAPHLDPSYNDGAIDVMIFFLTYWLAAQYEKEYTSGKSAQVRTFVMDVYFMDKYGMQDEIFDLPGGREYFGTVCYALFMVITATCSDSLTVKTANQEIPDLLNVTLASLKADYARCVDEHPGTKYPGTSMATFFQKEVTLDDVQNLMMKQEESEMSNLQNQGTAANPMCVDLGQSSIDPDVMPEAVDNMDNADGETAETAAEEEDSQTPYGPDDEAPAKTATPVG